MSTRGSNQVGSRAAIKKQIPTQKPDTANKAVGNKSSNGICGLRGSNQVSCIPSINKETVRLFKHLRSKMAKGLCSVRKRSPPAVSSSGRSKPSVIPVDSHRTEAIEDCIEFINSSSTLPRSNSVPASSC